MNQPLDQLIEVLCASLCAEVLPELRSDHARSQLAGVLDTLTKLERMVVWSPDVLQEQLAAMRGGIDVVIARVRQAGATPPVAGLPALPPQARYAELEQAVRAGERALADITDWLFGKAHGLAPGDRQAIEQLLRDTLRAALMPERKLVAKADFTSMTAGGAAPAGQDSSQ